MLENVWERVRRWRARSLRDLHADRTVDLIVSRSSDPQRILDIGCGAGYLLGQLAVRLPRAVRLAGVDPAPELVANARALTRDPRIEFAKGAAERLPFGDDAFDLVISMSSFDTWSNQRGGLAECRRVLKPGGQLVLVDHFSLRFVLTRTSGQRGQARTKWRANRLLADTGFRRPHWDPVYRGIRAATTTSTAWHRSPLAELHDR